MPEPLPPLPEDWERALCVAAHPDDLEYGMASAVARWTSQGKQVAYVLATRGEAGIDGMDPAEAAPLREQEERAGAREVGVGTVEFLDHRDGVVEYGLPLRRDLARAIRRHRPEVVVGGGYEVLAMGRYLDQADHRAVGLATLDAVRDAGNRWVFPELTDEGLEPWNGVRYLCLGGTNGGTHGVDVTGFLDRGTASLEAHRAYIDGLGDASFDPAEFLRGMTATFGEQAGVPNAVVFEVHEL
jgi:LmbE family N-acetylglucosaminyl deacetylase